MVARQIHPMTYLDREQSLEAISPDDGRSFELLGGEEIVCPSPSIAHQRVSGNTFRVIDRFNDVERLGELFTAPNDIRLSAYDVVVPDLCFVVSERRSIIGLKAIEGAPDLVVEIISPSTCRQDQVRKLALYAASGVREYWLIDIEARLLTMYTLRNGRYEPVQEQVGTLASVVLDGLVVTVWSLFLGLSSERPICA